MTEQTSASDRYEAAREALAEYLTEKAKRYPYTVASESMAAALRALITPPDVGEMPDLIGIYARAHRRALSNENGPYSQEQLEQATAAAMLALYRAGIQSAHESWEPEVALRPTQEAARKALAEYDQTAETYRDGMAHSLAEALRALITPPGVGESFDVDPADERLVRDELDRRVVRALEAELGLGALSDGEEDVTINTDRLIRTAQDIARQEARHGVQVAHETWEPEVALRPTQEQMLRWLGIDHQYEELNGVVTIHIFTQDIKREG